MFIQYINQWRIIRRLHKIVYEYSLNFETVKTVTVFLENRNKLNGKSVKLMTK